MVDRPLTPRHEKFAVLIVTGVDLKLAYQKAFPGKKSDKVLITAANRLLRSVGVAARIAELRRQVAERTAITVETVTNGLLSSIRQASALAMPGAAIEGWMGIAKIHGFIIDKSQVDMNVISRPVGKPTPEVELSVEEWQRRWPAPGLPAKPNGGST